MQCWGRLGHLHKADLPVQKELHSQVSSRAILSWEPPSPELHLAVRRTKGFFLLVQNSAGSLLVSIGVMPLSLGLSFSSVLSDTKSFTGFYTLPSALPILLKKNLQKSVLSFSPLPRLKPLSHFHPPRPLVVPWAQ